MQMSRAILLIRGIRFKDTRPQTRQTRERMELAGMGSVEVGGLRVAFLVEKELVWKLEDLPRMAQQHLLCCFSTYSNGSHTLLI